MMKHAKLHKKNTTHGTKNITLGSHSCYQEMKWVQFDNWLKQSHHKGGGGGEEMERKAEANIGGGGEERTKALEIKGENTHDKENEKPQQLKDSNQEPQTVLANVCV